MKKMIWRSMAFALLLSAGLLMAPEKAEARDGFKYATIAYFGVEGNCTFIVSECTADKGTTCNTVGSKSRGFKYCFSLPIIR